MNKKLIKSVFGIACIVASSVAHAALITFDELDNGTALSDQYASEGVLFSGEEGSVEFLPEVRSQQFISAPVSGLNYLTNFYVPGSTSPGDRLDSIIIDFLGRADNVSLFINTAGVQPISFDIYDSTDVFVNTVVLAGNESSNVFHSLGSNIGKLIARQPTDSWWWSLDNLAFEIAKDQDDTKAVPLPSMIGLILLGVVSIAARKSRR